MDKRPWKSAMILPVVVEGQGSPDGWVNASKALVSLLKSGRVTEGIHSKGLEVTTAKWC